MADELKSIGTAFASPTKQFFVSMLTRDIELRDALLDLLDNCVDGILRSAKPDPADASPYAGFEATIVMAPDHFQILDNCGGIPIETAKKYAFAMGKPEGATKEAVPATVGMYGIGMKRAVFKLGTDALVESWNDTGFSVEFTPEWMTTEGWQDLPVHELPDGKLKEKGTSITVMELNAEVKAAFSSGEWIDDFRKAVAQHYSIILSKGFSVKVGTSLEEAAQIDPEPFLLLQTDLVNGGRIAPYVYKGQLEGVDVEIYAGLYRELLTAEEADREEETRGTTDDAGWTVACNDRVVIWKDKTRLTGWGEAAVPNYHGQFIAITGIVLMRSDDPNKLPLTTTKRGIDAASNVYSEAKDLMREATKSLTSFTNKWKKFPEKLETIYQASEYVDLPRLRAMAAEVPMIASRKLPAMRKYEPTYPVPTEEKTHVVVRFEAPKTDVGFLGGVYFGEGEPAKPGDIGREAFDRALKVARDTAK
ncbi:ATP-binding protein [Brevundimonas sp.]|uniref:ATP-binding protein n=1 Tax=Brevundimonas sp. TaxID=1871086 RepID=UPI002ED863A3